MKTIDFMKFRLLALVLSVCLVAGSILSLAVNGLSLGLDFTGGTLIEVGYQNDADLEAIRGELKANGFEDAVVQQFGSSHDVLIRVPPVTGKEASTIGDDVYALLKQSASELTLRRVEFVGPQVGDELRDQSGIAMLMALALMLVYVTLRFTNKFALGSVVALFHDVVITLGFFSVFQLQFDLTVLAAVLAVIGYSLNDTIVVADRIRENFRKMRVSDPVDIINISITQTLDRTLITSGTTLMVLLALFFLGGELIHNFSLALLLGIGVGTYSSIYVASSLLVLLNISKDDFIRVEKEEIDEMP